MLSNMMLRSAVYRGENTMDNCYTELRDVSNLALCWMEVKLAVMQCNMITQSCQPALMHVGQGDIQHVV